MHINHHEIIKLLLYFIAAMSTSTMGGYAIDPRIAHHLSAEFSTMLHRVGDQLQECTSVGSLKEFLQCYSHPMYPDKLYIEPHVYCDAKTVKGVLLHLYPRYINYMDHYVLDEILHTFGNEECRYLHHKYEHVFQRSVCKLRDHPAPMTDVEIEECSSQKRLRVTISDDGRTTPPHDLHTVQGAIKKATGVSQAGQVYVHQDPGN